MKGMKIHELNKLNTESRKDKLKELRLELVKSKIASSKTHLKTKEIKKAIARLLTLAQADKKQHGRKQ